jgi:hypothetical protein
MQPDNSTTLATLARVGGRERNVHRSAGFGVDHVGAPETGLEIAEFGPLGDAKEHAAGDNVV